MTEFRSGDLYRIEIAQAVDTDRTVRTVHGDMIRPVRINHLAYIYKGGYYRFSILLDEDGDNLHIYSDDELAGWPKPPHWFDVEALRLKLLADELQAVAS